VLFCCCIRTEVLSVVNFGDRIALAEDLTVRAKKEQLGEDHAPMASAPFQVPL
jgi:hypothetical protein